VAVLYGAFRELSRKLAASMERLGAMAVTDQLTGVSNRRKLMEEGARALDICRRGEKPCSALMLDIDFFKKVNDTHGHAAGDTVLKTVAGALGACIRSSDILARYGGEEFAIIAPNSGLADAVLLAGRLREAVEASVAKTDGGELKVTVSVGAAAAGAETTGLDKLLSMADAALYRAKKNGRNRVEAQDAVDAA
jgi:diguanylate cyclase (GGDEF)-like protein